MTSFPSEIVNNAYVNELSDTKPAVSNGDSQQTWDDAVAELEKNNLAESPNHGWGVQPSKRGGIKETYPHETWADWGIKGPETCPGRMYVQCPFAEKDVCKALGGRWDTVRPGMACTSAARLCTAWARLPTPRST